MSVSVTIPELVSQIGEQQVELRAVRRQLAASQEAVKVAEAEVVKLRAEVESLRTATRVTGD